jgi:hypothetical protein
VEAVEGRPEGPLCLDALPIELHGLSEVKSGGGAQSEPRREQLVNETQVHAEVRRVEILHVWKEFQNAVLIRRARALCCFPKLLHQQLTFLGGWLNQPGVDRTIKVVGHGVHWLFDFGRWNVGAKLAGFQVRVNKSRTL